MGERIGRTWGQDWSRWRQSGVMPERIRSQHARHHLGRPRKAVQANSTEVRGSWSLTPLRGTQDQSPSQFVLLGPYPTLTG